MMIQVNSGRKLDLQIIIIYFFFRTKDRGIIYSSYWMFSRWINFKAHETVLSFYTKFILIDNFWGYSKCSVAKNIKLEIFFS